MIVVDLGCQTHGDQNSIDTLIDRYKPQILYGFDPHPETHDQISTRGTTTLVTARKAAWVIDGTHGYQQDGTASRLVPGGGDTRVQTFDLAAWLFTLPRVPTVLKLDVEGAEHQLLPHLRHRMADTLLAVILVEWHGEPASDFGMACPLEDWH